MIGKTLTSKVEETNDGTGDVIITIPEEIIKYNNWKEGKAIMMEVKDNKVYLSALPDNDVA